MKEKKSVQIPLEYPQRFRFFRDGQSSIWDAVRWKGTILPSIVLVCCFFTAWSTLVLFLYKCGYTWVAIDDKLVSLLTTSMALLLGFRTNRAFDRYWTGSQLFTSLLMQLRNLSRLLWNGVHTSTNESLEEKEQIMKLLLAVAIATKHAVRGEVAYKHSDLMSLLPVNFTSTSYKSSLIRGSSALEISQTSTDHQHYPTVINVPLEIISTVGSYVRKERKFGGLEVEDSGLVMSLLNAVNDSVAKFEQIIYVPLPAAYDAHMKQLLLLFFIALPFQLIRSLGIATIPIVMVTSFALIGTDAIASEIEEPFGHDANDLPLDFFCEKLREDIEYIMERPLLTQSSDKTHSRKRSKSPSIAIDVNVSHNNNDRYTSTNKLRTMMHDVEEEMNEGSNMGQSSITNNYDENHSHLRRRSISNSKRK